MSEADQIPFERAMASKLYLDVCCYNRILDDQRQPRIQMEAEAVEAILSLVESGKVLLVSSEAVDAEIRKHPIGTKRADLTALVSLAGERRVLDSGVERRASGLVAEGYGVYDALHLAFAEAAEVSAILTTDDKFLSLARRGLGSPAIAVRNPLSWWEEFQQ